MHSSEAGHRASEKGQAVVEFALMVPIFALLLQAMLFSARFFLAKLFLMQVVREGYFNMVYADLSAAQTEEFLQSRFCDTAQGYFTDFSVKVDEEKSSARLLPVCVRAQGGVALSGLSSAVLGQETLAINAQLSGYAGTDRGASFLERDISNLLNRAGLHAEH